MNAYFRNIKIAASTMAAGLKLTFRYLFEARKSRMPVGIADPSYFDIDKGIVTLQYPYESLPVPDVGRYRLHNEIDDCIVCDKCAKVCPVDCIEIDAIKAPEVFGTTSDGTPKRIHAAKFDIDMSKCCFCGLCTTVCPTECLTMTKAYDFSEFDVNDHVYAFGTMSLADIAQKRQDLEKHETEKAAAKTQVVTKDTSLPKVGVKPQMKPKVGGAKPVLKPKISTDTSEEQKAESINEGKSKPVFRPKPMMKAKPVIAPKPIESKTESTAKPTDEASESKNTTEEPAKSKFRPRPMIKKRPKPDDND